jgi:uncharacterized protein YcbK (DUF882 family)
MMLAAAGTSQIVANSDRARVISLYSIHTKETVSVLYKKDGKYIDAGLEKASWALRDWRRNEATKMDPELIDLLWEMHAELGSKEPIHIISGYRSRDTNNMLRRTVGGQASESRHILGKAADVHFPDVPLKNLRYSALIRERGGVGYYPTSALPFVHVDTDRVRAWPRLPRYELALLFPQGRTQHLPAEGGPISREDVKIARSQHKELATQIAEYRTWRTQSKQPFAVADTGGGLRSAEKLGLVASLEPASRRQDERPIAGPEPRLRSPGPSLQDRARLNEMAAFASLEPRLISGPRPARRDRPDPIAGLLSTQQASDRGPVGQRMAAIDPSAASGSQNDGQGGRFGWGTGWIAAPAYDDEHPEELSYRPFPIGPLLTASPNDPVFAELVHHDVSRTIDMLDQPGSALPLRLRPGEQMAQLMWAHQFRGDAIGLAKLFEAQASDITSSSLANRNVRTTRR